MRIGKPSAEQVLVVVNLVLAVNLVVLFVVRDTGAAPAGGSPAFSGGPRLLVVVAEQSPADAAVAQPVADARGGDVLVVPASGLSDAVSDGLSESPPARVLVLGGPEAVSEQTMDALREVATGTVRRLAGSTRYDTAARVATLQFEGPVARVRIVSGEATGLLPQPRHSEGSSAPVLLVERDRIPPSTAAALRQLRPQRIEVVGGDRAVSDAVVQQLQAAARGRVVRLP